jgi:peroxiredoxin family protein
MDKATIIVHSGDMDKIYSALIVGNGALSMGMEASLYFTFWGLQRLKKNGLDKGKLSKMNMMGMGRWMVRKKEWWSWRSSSRTSGSWAARSLPAR